MHDRAWHRNEFARHAALIAVDEVARGDMAAAEEAFSATPGEFADKLIAAVTAATLAQVQYEKEKHLRIPDNPESLTAAELDALVRPFSDMFLRSQASKTELLEALERVVRRQREHAEWAPHEHVDPLPPPPHASTGRYISTKQDRAKRDAYEQMRNEYIEQL